MKKLFTIFLWLFSYDKKMRLGDLKFVSNKKTLSVDNTADITDWSEEQLELKKKILNGDYVDGFVSLITISRDNICVEGWDMLRLLKEIENPEYVITVKKLYLIKWSRFHEIYKEFNS